MARTSYSFSQFHNFVRATSKYVMGASGLLVPVASGSPGLAYDPLTQAFRGILLEQGATNLLPSSASLSGTFTAVSQGTLALNAATAPDGTLTAAAVISNSVSGPHYIECHFNTGFNPNTARTYSIFLKAGSQNRISFQLYPLPTLVELISVTVSSLPSNPTITTNATGQGIVTGAGVEALANGWVRVWVTGQISTSLTDTGIDLRVIPTQNASWIGDGVTPDFYVWQPQVELPVNVKPTSIIPTSGTIAARAADVLFYAFLSPWYSPTGGTIVWCGALREAAGAASQTLIHFDDGTTSNYIEIRNVAGTLNIEAIVVAGGATQFQQVIGTVTAVTQFAVGLAMTSNNFGVSMNGGPVTGSSSGAMPAGITEGFIGCRDSAGNNSLNGWYFLSAFVPTALSASDLPKVTNPATITQLLNL